MERSIDYTVKDGAKVSTDDRYGDLFDGGYIKPEEILEDHVAGQYVAHAVQVIKDFFRMLEQQGVLEDR